MFTYQTRPVELGQGVCAYYKLIAIFRRLTGKKITRHKFILYVVGGVVKSAIITTVEELTRIPNVQ